MASSPSQLPESQQYAGNQRLYLINLEKRLIIRVNIGNCLSMFEWISQKQLKDTMYILEQKSSKQIFQIK